MEIILFSIQIVDHVLIVVVIVVEESVDLLSLVLLKVLLLIGQPVVVHLGRLGRVGTLERLLRAEQQLVALVCVVLHRMLAVLVAAHELVLERSC